MLGRLKDFISHVGSVEEPTTPPEDERRLACAALMIEVAIIDQEFDEKELASMKNTLIAQMNIDAEEVDTLISNAQNECSDATSLYQFTSSVNQHCSQAEKFKLLVGMWSIAFADGDLDKYEEYIIRKVSDLLHVAHGDFIRAKQQARQALTS